MPLKKLQKRVVKHIFSTLEDRIIDQLATECENQVCRRFSFSVFRLLHDPDDWAQIKKIKKDPKGIVFNGKKIALKETSGKKDKTKSKTKSKSSV